MMGLSLLSSAMLDELSDVFQITSCKFGWVLIGCIHQTALGVILMMLFAIVVCNVVV